MTDLQKYIGDSKKINPEWVKYWTAIWKEQGIYSRPFEKPTHAVEKVTVSESKPFLPIYSRPPCQKVSEREERFDDGWGHTGILTIIKYLDKSKKEQEMVGRVKWNKEAQYYKMD